MEQLEGRTFSENKLNDFVKALVLVTREHKLTKSMITTLAALYACSDGKAVFSTKYVDLYLFFPVTYRERDSNMLPTEGARRKYVWRQLKAIEEYQERSGIIYYTRYRVNRMSATCFDITNLREMIEINCLTKGV